MLTVYLLLVIQVTSLKKSSLLVEFIGNILFANKKRKKRSINALIATKKLLCLFLTSYR